MVRTGRMGLTLPQPTPVRCRRQAADEDSAQGATQDLSDGTLRQGRDDVRPEHPTLGEEIRATVRNLQAPFKAPHVAC
jgi:hypothetical protein